MKKVSLVVHSISIALFLLLSSAAYGGGVGGLYLGGNVGSAMVSDIDLSDQASAGFGVPVKLYLEFDAGFAVGGIVGYDFFGPSRVEGEVAYQSNDADSINASALGQSISSGFSGDVSYLSFLVNGYYDFHNSSIVTPYVSGGVGLSNVSLNEFNIDEQGTSRRLMRMIRCFPIKRDSDWGLR